MKLLFVFSASVALLCIASGFPTKQDTKGMQLPQINPLPDKDLPEPLQPKKKPQDEGSESEGDEQEDVEPEGGEEEGEELQEEKGVKTEKEENTGPQTEEEMEEEEEAELNPNLFEGDLKLSKEEIDKLDENTIAKKDAIASAARRWTDARVPFVLSRDFAKDKNRRRVLANAIRELNSKTCVRFVPRKSSDKDFILFVLGDGCYSTAVGKKKGKQIISIGRGCNYKGTVIHEMMHAIGFFHEHTRLDRDQYVTINWANIEKGKESQFKKYGHGEADYLGESYDYDSVMHYPRNGFGVVVNGKRLATIVPKDKPWRKIGQRNGPSKIDLAQINKLYKCTKFTSKDA